MASIVAPIVASIGASIGAITHLPLGHSLSHDADDTLNNDVTLLCSSQTARINWINWTLARPQRPSPTPSTVEFHLELIDGLGDVTGGVS